MKCSATHFNQDDVIYMVLEETKHIVRADRSQTYCGTIPLGLEAETVPNRVAL